MLANNSTSTDDIEAGVGDKPWLFGPSKELRLRSILDAKIQRLVVFQANIQINLIMGNSSKN